MRFTTRTVFAPVGTHLYLPPRASKAAPRGHPSTCSGSPRVTSFAYDGARPKSSLRSKVAYGSKEAAAGIRLRRLDAARTDSGGYFAAETEGDVMRSFAEDGSHAPPGASHNMPFCSTGGTRQRPRCRSGGRRPAAKRGLSRKVPRRYRFQGGPFRLRPRPPLLVLVAAPLGFRPPPGASPLVAPSRAALQAAPTPALRGTAAVKPGFRLQVFAGIPASPLAVLIGGRVSLPPKTSAPPRRRKRAPLRQAPRRQSRHVAC